MKTTRFFLLPALLCLLTTTILAANDAARARRWRAPSGLKEILMNHREAQGMGDYGREKLKGMSAIRVTRKITHSGSASYSAFCEAKEPDRIRTENGTGEVTITTASFRVESDKGVVNRSAGSKSSDSVIAMCLIAPSKSATVEKVRLVAKEKLNGKPTYHLLAMDDVGNYDEWIDAKDYTLVQRKQSGVILNTTEEWNDFRQTNGLMVPFDHFTRNTSTLNPWTEDEALTGMDFDPRINDTDFAADATKPAMGGTQGGTQSGGTQASGTQASGTVLSGNVGGQNVSVDVNSALAALSGRPQPQQQPAQQGSTTAPATSESPNTSNPNAAQTTIANQVAQAAANPNQTMTAAQQAAAKGQTPAVPGAPTGTVVRQIGHGQIMSPACSDATNLVAIDEVSTGYKDPSADMRFTVTNTGTEDLYVERVNCRETSKMKPRDSKRCIYASKSGWVVLVAKYRDVNNPSSGNSPNTCSQAFNAASSVQESKLGFGR